jgi:hypothetical protein
MSTTTTPAFDFREFKRALEERDSTGQLALYALDAEVTLIDRIHTPAAPRVLRGRAEIRTWIEDICERDMTHRFTTGFSFSSDSLVARTCDNTWALHSMWSEHGSLDRAHRAGLRIQSGSSA